MLKLYYANISLLDDEQVFQAVLEKVNIQRREKVLRCKHKQDQMRSLLAGYLLRLALEKEGIDYSDTTISILESGKPVIVDNSNLFFSLSHAGDYAACLISNHNIGVDIETKTKSLFMDGKEEKLQAVVEKILTPKERIEFSAKNQEEKVEYFLRTWTRKECYSKADGRGLSIGLEQIETESESFFSKWLDESTMISVFVENNNFSDLQIEEIACL